MKRKKKLICEMCGEEFLTAAHNTKLCPSCRYEKQRKEARERYHKVKAGIVKPKPRKRKKKKVIKIPEDEWTICWKCANAVPDPDKGTGCNWSTALAPVEGWTVTVRERSSISGCVNVRKCPEYVRG